MKLKGSKRKGRHLFKNAGIVDDGKQENGKAKEKNWKKTLLKVLLIVGAAIVVLVIAFYIYIKWGVKAPVGKTSPRGSGYTKQYYDEIDPDNPTPPKTAVGAKTYEGVEKVPNKYTFLILGTDQEGGNTDTIMVATFDSGAYTMEVASIPRDTLVNVSWSLKKVNSIYANMLYRHRDEKDKKTREEKALQATVEMFADLLGYEVDFAILVDMRAFVKLVDEIGGVDFYVPRRMDYEDPEQNLYIHYSEGLQHLKGQQALEVMRFRSVPSADIWRIGNQQDFLTTVAKQILANQSSLNIRTLAGVFIDYVKTDMSLNDTIWIAMEVLKMDAENIHFSTAPGDYGDSFYGNSYVTLYVNEWLEMVNTKLNPWSMTITAEDVSIYTRGADKKLYVTDGNWAGNPSWGSGGSSGSNSSSNSSGNNSSGGNNAKPNSGGNQNSPPQGGEPQGAQTDQTTVPDDNAPPVDDLDGPIDGLPDETPGTDPDDDTETGEPGESGPNDGEPGGDAGGEAPAADSPPEEPPQQSAPPPPVEATQEGPDD